MVANWMKRFECEGLHLRFTACADNPPIVNERAESEGEESRPGDHTKIKGRGIVYDETTLIGDWFYERIAPGAATKSMAEREVLSRYNHALLLGRQGNGSLILTDDDKALSYEVMPNPNTTAGRDALAMAARRDLGGSSFSFVDVRVEEEKKYKDGLSRYTVREMRLYELGPVDTPAYAGTGVPEARGSEEVQEHWRRVVESRSRLTSGGVAMDEYRALRTRLDLLNLRLRFESR